MTVAQVPVINKQTYEYPVCYHHAIILISLLLEFFLIQNFSLYALNF